MTPLKQWYCRLFSLAPTSSMSQENEQPLT